MYVLFHQVIEYIYATIPAEVHRNIFIHFDLLLEP